MGGCNGEASCRRSSPATRSLVSTLLAPLATRSVIRRRRAGDVQGTNIVACVLALSNEIHAEAIESLRGGQTSHLYARGSHFAAYFMAVPAQCM